MPRILQKPPASTILRHTASKQLEGSQLMEDRKEQARLGSQLSELPKKELKLILSATNFILILRILMLMTVLGAPMYPCVLRTSFRSSSVMLLKKSMDISLLSKMRSSLRYLFRLSVPMGMFLKHWKSGYPSKTGMISMKLAPAETTRPEQRPVRQRGVTQLRASQIFSTFSFLNITFAMAYKMRLSVKTFSRMMTVLPVQEQLIWEKKILYSSSSRPFSNFYIQTEPAEGNFKLLPVFSVFLGTLSPTRPTRIFSPPSQMMMSQRLVFSIMI